jgi:hypothetical protein
VCAPGHYIGNFAGNYMTSLYANGTVPVHFSTKDSNGKPGFEFWLEAVTQPCPPNNEFCPEAVVKGGKLRGFATPFTDPDAGLNADAGASNPFALSVRFEIDLSGELDCAAGKFRGQLQNGCWDVFSVLLRFSGTLESGYDSASSTFTGGTWDITEMPTMNSTPPTGTKLGGTGEWGAKLADTGMSPIVTGKGLCDGMSGFDTPAQ